jgi:endonuclease III
MCGMLEASRKHRYDRLDLTPHSAMSWKEYVPVEFLGQHHEQLTEHGEGHTRPRKLAARLCPKVIRRREWCKVT